jgi:dipeptidyl aminopeptidase/acylaminoacyl peptidase
MRLAYRLLPLVFASPLIAQTSSDTVNYQRADLMRVSGAFVAGTNVRPNWLEDSIRFWYKSGGKGDRGTHYLVDPRSGSRRILFDHNRMAAALSVAADTILDPMRFPSFTLVNKESTLEVPLRKKTFHCEIASYRCAVPDTVAIKRKKFLETGPEWAARSPDKQWDAFKWRNDIYVRPASASNAEFDRQQDSIKQEVEKKTQDSIRKARGEKVEEAKPAKKTTPDSLPLPSESIRLTTDGEERFSYGNEVRDLPREKAKIKAERTQVKWSPDSKRIAVLKTDTRNVRIYPIYSSTKDQPEDRSYVYAAPGDTILARYQIHILDVANRSNITVKDEMPPNIVHGMTGLSAVAWGRSSDKLYALNATRGSHRVRLNMIDANTGDLKTQIARDSNSTFVELQPGGSGANWAVVNNGEDIIWYSQRDGWGHFYRFDEQGKLKNQIEAGPYAVHTLLKVDSVRKQIYFTAGGRESGSPYHVRIYRINFDGSGMTLLTPEDAVHQATFVPKADYFIDSYSRVDTPPVIVLRNMNDGKVVMELSRGDASLLTSIGWTPGELFIAKARDGVTDLWGIMYRPSTFDPTKSYPIISHIYPGPQRGSVTGWGFAGASDPRALAELGFIIIQLNHQGSPGRSKSFHDFYYGNMGDNGIPDHIAVIRQLAAKNPWIDINRVGIYGHSGGGLASTDAILRWPDFFKVAVSGAGNHHPATYGFFWAEKYQGLYDKKSYDAAANYTLAKNLKGHLLLMHGDMDNNVHPAATLKVVDALIKANKGNFDMIIFPDAGHGLPDYSIRKQWDYFVTWLLGKTPPAEYEMMRVDRNIE